MKNLDNNYHRCLLKPILRSDSDIIEPFVFHPRCGYTSVILVDDVVEVNSLFARSPEYLTELLRSQRIELWSSTLSVMRMFFIELRNGSSLIDRCVTSV